MFLWLPESQARVPFQTLPSSYLKTTFLKPEQSLPSPQREKWWRLITSLRVVDCGLFIWGDIFRHRNNSSPDNDWKAKWHWITQISEWRCPRLRHTYEVTELLMTCSISERSSPGEDSCLLLSWCGLRVSTAIILGRTTSPKRRLSDSTLATGCRGRKHSTDGRNMALIRFYLDTGAQLITGHQGLSCYRKGRYRNPCPATYRQQKNELMKLKSFKFLMKNLN